MSERVVKQAAILERGVIFTAPRPARHGNLIHAIHELGLPAPIGGPTGIQGFVDAEGRFLTRSEAKWVAWLAGQITRERHKSGIVFCTEDLW